MTRKYHDARWSGRFTAVEKAAILDHVHLINARRGSGGLAAAARRFGVAPVLVAAWIRHDRSRGILLPERLRQLDEFRDLHLRISRFEKRLARMRSRIAQLKASL